MSTPTLPGLRILLLEDPTWRRELGAAARANVEANFTWAGCGRATVAAYEDALR